MHPRGLAKTLKYLFFFAVKKEEMQMTLTFYLFKTIHFIFCAIFLPLPQYAIQFFLV